MKIAFARVLSAGTSSPRAPLSVPRGTIGGMGMEIVVVDRGQSVPALLSSLAAAGLASSVMMVDGQLWPPAAALPSAWRDLRLRTPAGTVTVARRAGGLAVVVFGNADAALSAAQRQVAEALDALPASV